MPAHQFSSETFSNWDEIASGAADFVASRMAAEVGCTQTLQTCPGKPCAGTADAASDDTAEAVVAVTSSRESDWVVSHHALKSARDKRETRKE
jgi:hypothetical protein